MGAIVNIVEIIRPAEQGRSGPYICKGEDGFLYYVKGRNTGRRSQIIEWLCAHLATAFGLPLPSFALVDIAPELLAETPDAMREVRAGLAFGSREYPHALWFELEQIDKVSEVLQRDILIFDWWVHNTDRLTHNSNMLWDATRNKVVVIDHNMAFDPDFNPRDFIVDHIFGAQAARVFEDLVEQAQYQGRLSTALDVWSQACDMIPDEWRWFDDEHTVPTHFDFEAARNLLRRCELVGFWRMV